jgi:fatty-acyl-CoA synthase
MTIDGLMQPTPLTLHSIFERMATVHADGVLVDRGRGTRSTYGEMAERVRRLATILTDELGVRPGDRVASYTWNSAPHFELYWAVPLVGAVLHTANIRLYADQVAYTLNHAQDRVAFVHPDLAGAFEEVRPQLTTVERVVDMGDEYDKLLADARPASSFVEVPENAACGLCYTSGTTGMPKGVLSSHRALWLHSMATCMADSIGLTEHDRVLPVVPMFHAFGWGLPYSAPFTGAELVLHGADSSADNVARILSEERVTVAAAVPTIWKELLPVLRRGELDLSSLRLVFVGGSASPRSLIEAYEDLGIEYLQVWGMTETGPLACASRPRRRHRGAGRDEVLDLKERTGTILPGLEARVVDDSGDSVIDAVGELEVRGPWIAAAYFDDDSSGEKFHDGWLRTGDMAVMEADGFFRIVDRAKDLVKSGGEWISSVELEGHILAHPDVADAAVVGLPSKKWDERPVAVVVAANGVEPTLESVRDFLADRVAKWWLPDELVVVDEIPKTSVGKLDKKVLRAQLAHIELP